MKSFYLVFFLFLWLILGSYLGLLRFNLREILFGKALAREALLGFLNKESHEQSSSPVPDFGFFSEIVKMLLKTRKTSGAQINEALLELKKNMRLDAKKQRQVQSVILGGLFQFLIIVAMTYIFAYSTGFSIGISLEVSQYLLVAALHFTGLVFYLFGIFILKKKYFSDFYSYLASFYTLKSLLGASYPLNEALNSSGVNELSKSKGLEFLKKRLMSFIKKMKDSGDYSLRELDFLLDEIWDVYDFKLEQFQKALLGLKLLLMSVFGLSGFLYIISTLLTRMPY